MRIAISNQYWATAGGGESYALGIAHALSEVGDVELLTPAAVDWHHVADRLQTNVIGFHRRIVDFTQPDALRAATAEYDLVVNTTWASDLFPAGGRNLLVVHFPVRPSDDLDAARRLALRALTMAGVLERSNPPLLLSGFQPLEPSARPFRWTNGDALIALALPARRLQRLQLVFGCDTPEPTEVAIDVDGTPAAAATVGGGGGVGETVVSVPVDPRSTSRTTLVRIRSAVFSPSQILGTGDDHRQLGVQLLEVRGVSGWASRSIRRAGLTAHAEASRWYRNYDRVIVNSDFTGEWLQRWWGVGARTIHPAVSPRLAARKEPIVLSVGRFFPPERGHSKRQLDLVRAFRRLAADGDIRRWQLHLVGGCQPEDRPYLDRVRAESDGLPIRFHVDADGQSLAELFGRASIYWHGTGLGEPRGAPERHEHFGIAVVEAMSAGAVPVVYSVGGPASTVRPHVDGLHFASTTDLVAETRRLITDDELRLRLARSAAVRAGEFSHDEMKRRLRRVIDEVAGARPASTVAGGAG